VAKSKIIGLNQIQNGFRSFLQGPIPICKFLPALKGNISYLGKLTYFFVATLNKTANFLNYSSNKSSIKPNLLNFFAP